MRPSNLLPVLLLLLPALSFSQSAPDYQAQAKALVAQMTLEEKAGLCSGQTAWTTKAIDRLYIPAIFMTDGPHGLRKAEGYDFTNSVPATCFPTASALASSWNPDLAQEMGVALGEECQANNVQILLGPGVNMKRSPLGGRNFEYFSEDPILAGKMASSLIQGVQSQGVGTSLKHFAANNQEFERMTNNSMVDERSLREIYFPAFEIAVKEAKPWTVMCSYNLLNGTYASENEWLLTTVLRKDWGFENFVVSDWGAVNNRPLGVQAGLNLEMPSSNGFNDAKIVAAVKNGALKMEDLDRSVTELLAVILKANAAKKPGFTYDPAAHQALARKVDGECIVLLQNKDNLLPIGAKPQKVAIIGAFAKNPRYQGAGSSQVKPTQMANAWDELQKLGNKNLSFTYAQGYNEDGSTTPALLSEAATAARHADIVLVFAGLPSIYESEGYDRKNIDLPEGHNKVIETVAFAQQNTVVVLMNGSAVAMPWVGKVKGIVEGWLGGQAGGGALADVLTGAVNPSGKLSETFPVRLEDTPAYPIFPGQNAESRYGEGPFIGYRYYDTKKITPLFPFGFGLSYTNFAYSDLKVDKSSVNDNEPLHVSVKVKNTGKVTGKEIVQLYVREKETVLPRPDKELKHFAKVELKPGEEKTVNFDLNYRDYAYFDVKLEDWAVHAGKFDILVGGASNALPLVQTIDVKDNNQRFPKLTRNSMLKELAANPKGKPVYDSMIDNAAGPLPEHPTASQLAEHEKTKAMMAVFLNDLPLGKMVAMSQGKMTEEMIDGILQSINQ